MKVLFYIRDNHTEVKGGDLVQLESTAAGLRRLGVEVELSSDSKADLSPYDIIHIFNSPRFDECLAFLANAKSQQKPVAVSTIFWSKDELGVGVADSSKVRLAKKIFGIKASIVLWRLLKGISRLKAGSNYRLEKELFSGATMLLPNSEGEMREIFKVYKLMQPYHAVRNAIETTTFSQVPSLKREDFVLSVGRIESRKNTLALIEAGKAAKAHLVFIGQVERGNPYNEVCLKKITDYNFEYLGAMQPQDIAAYYYKARVHAMASWYETPGLATMEAACGGATIMSTNRGSTKEYFGELAYYCDPFSTDSIIEALTQAIAEEPRLSLRNKIMEEYTWDLAAQDTLNAYREILA